MNIDRIPPDIHFNENGEIVWTPRLIDFNARAYTRGHTVTADEFNTELIKQTYQGNYNTDTINVLTKLYGTVNRNSVVALEKATTAESVSKQALEDVTKVLDNVTDITERAETAVERAEEALATIDEFATDEDIVNALKDYYTTTEVDDLIKNVEVDLSDYYTKSQTYSREEIDNKISLIPKFSIKVVTTLPTENISETTVYLVKDYTITSNLYTEYIYVNDTWEILGVQKVDLSNYYTKEEVDNALSNVEVDLTDYVKTEIAENKAIKFAESERLKTLNLFNVNKASGSRSLFATWGVSLFDILKQEMIGKTICINFNSLIKVIQITNYTYLDIETEDHKIYYAAGYQTYLTFEVTQDLYDNRSSRYLNVYSEEIPKGQSTFGNIISIYGDKLMVTYGDEPQSYQPYRGDIVHQNENERTVYKFSFDFLHSQTVDQNGAYLTDNQGNTSHTIYSHGRPLIISGAIEGAQTTGGNCFVTLYVDGASTTQYVTSSATHKHTFSLNFILTNLSVGYHTISFFANTNAYSCVFNNNSLTNVTIFEV